MNQTQIWCIVKPTVGLPLFIAGVAITSLTVHFAILNNTTWMAAFWQGGVKKAAEITAPAPKLAEGPAYVITK